MSGRKAKKKAAGIERRAFLLWNAVALAGALVPPLFVGPLRRVRKDRDEGREGKYYRKLEGGE